MRITIRRALFLAFAGLVLALTCALVTLSLLEEDRLVAGLAAPVIERMQTHAGTELQRRFDPVRSRLAVHVRRIRAGQIRVGQPDALKDLLLPSIRELQGAHSMMVGDESGYQFLLMRYDQSVIDSPLLAEHADLPAPDPDQIQFFTREFWPGSAAGRSEWTLWDPNGTQAVCRWSVDLPDYDPRQRPWHVRALQHLRQIEAEGRSDADPAELIAWTRPYLMFTSKTPGISVCVAARDPEGRAVIAAYDLLLSNLGEFTRAQRPTPRGKVFVLSDDGVLLAAPGGTATASPRPEPALQPVAEADDPVLAGWMSARDASRRQPAAAPSFTFQVDGELWWGGGAPFRLDPQQLLWMGVAIPQRDLLDMIGHNPRRFLLAAVLGLLVALLLAGWVARWFSRPMRNLVQHSRRIGDLVLDDPPAPITTPLAEVQELGLALTTMRTALRDHIRARELVSRALAESEERFRMTFEQAAVGLSHTGLDRRLLLVNDKLCDILGRPREELVGMSVADLTHPDDRASDAARLQELMEGQRTWDQWDKRYLHPDGSVRWANVTVGLRRHPDGRPMHFMAVIQDISQRRRLQEQLQQSQKLEAVGRLAGGIAHDFNNLLTIISGYSGMARAALPADHPAHAEIGEVERAAISAASLVRQLLAFARRSLPTPRVIDLAAEIASNERMLRHLLGEHIELRTAAAGAPHHVLMDPVQFQQILVNLTVNAKDAMPGGGVLRITLDRHRDEGPAQGEIRLTISDTGVGMSEEVRAHAFEPFFTTKAVGQGSGLGLATCYGIVEHSGGSIRVDSAPGAGTTFHLSWPESRAAAATGTGAPAAGDNGHETILVVEDDQQIRSLTRRVLTERGYRVLLADSGPAALDIAASEPAIDLLLTDVIMPGMDGGQLAQQLRDSRPELRVLFVSGYPRAALRDRIPDGTSLLTKPYTAEQLGQHIRNLLDSR